MHLENAGVSVVPAVWIACPIKSTSMLDLEGLSLKDIAKKMHLHCGENELFIEVAPFNEMCDKENTHSQDNFWFQLLYLYAWGNTSMIHITSITERNYDPPKIIGRTPSLGNSSWKSHTIAEIPGHRGSCAALHVANSKHLSVPGIATSYSCFAGQTCSQAIAQIHSGSSWLSRK